MKFERIRHRLADFYNLPRIIGTTHCLWCGSETDPDRPMTIYWKYGWQIIPFRADLCSGECVQDILEYIHNVDHRVRDDIDPSHLGGNR